MLTQDVLREEPKFTEVAFARLLAWLDDGVDSDGERYLEMRRRLVSYFERRNCPHADDLADETFNRIGRTLAEHGVIATKPPARYCYVVARFVLLEDFRRQRRHVPLNEQWPIHADRSALHARDSGRELQEQRLDCLDRCLDELKPAQRDLIIDYYADARRQKIERRQELARTLGITMNALAIRAWRIRDALTTCVDACRGARRQI